MIYKIRIVLDTKEDVIRTLWIDATNTLEDFHKVIAQVFGFNGQEMASFFRSDDTWNQGEEIPLCSMEDHPDALCMGNTILQQNIEDVGEKLIYVYDYLNMWTFYCELLEVVETVNNDLPKLILSIGETPEEAPEKEFKAATPQEGFDLEDEEFGNEFNSFENIDDLDLDNY